MVRTFIDRMKTFRLSLLMSSSLALASMFSPHIAAASDKANNYMEEMWGIPASDVVPSAKPADAAIKQVAIGNSSTPAPQPLPPADPPIELYSLSHVGEASGKTATPTSASTPSRERRSQSKAPRSLSSEVPVQQQPSLPQREALHPSSDMVDVNNPALAVLLGGSIYNEDLTATKSRFALLNTLEIVDNQAGHKYQGNGVIYVYVDDVNQQALQASKLSSTIINQLGGLSRQVVTLTVNSGRVIGFAVRNDRSANTTSKQEQAATRSAYDPSEPLPISSAVYNNDDSVSWHRAGSFESYSFRRSPAPRSQGSGGSVISRQKDYDMLRGSAPNNGSTLRGMPNNGNWAQNLRGAVANRPNLEASQGRLTVKSGPNGSVITTSEDGGQITFTPRGNEVLLSGDVTGTLDSAGKLNCWPTHHAGSSSTANVDVNVGVFLQTSFAAADTVRGRLGAIALLYQAFIPNITNGQVLEGPPVLPTIHQSITNNFQIVCSTVSGTCSDANTPTRKVVRNKGHRHAAGRSCWSKSGQRYCVKKIRVKCPPPKKTSSLPQTGAIRVAEVAPPFRPLPERKPSGQGYTAC